jgi:hypothetical protein
MYFTRLFLAMSITGVAWPAASPAMQPASSAEVCGRCHRAIFDSWKTSSHADAMQSTLFQDALQLAEGDFGAKARKVCLGCHAPLAIQTGDLGLARKASWEGVTCDYCHSLRSVSLQGVNPTATLTAALVKSGPLRDTAPSPHGTVYSEVHTTSLVCAPCHEYKNGSGFQVLTTYSEWQNSAYAKQGKSCQSCHMNRVGGDVVDPHIQRSSVAKINLHQMPGSNSLPQLAKAVKAQLSATRDGDRIKVVVSIANRSAGHYLPTGSPLRQLLLEVRADDVRGQSFRAERTYARTVADTHGTPIAREHFAFVKATQVLADTRLAPGEQRSETFWFPISAAGQTRVKATFWYYYSPLAKAESQKRIVFLILNQLVQ